MQAWKFKLVMWAPATDPELLDLQLVLVQLVAEETVLLVEVVHGVVVLQPQGIDQPLALVQFDSQRFSGCTQTLAAALNLLQPDQMLK